MSDQQKPNEINVSESEVERRSVIKGGMASLMPLAAVPGNTPGNGHGNAPGNGLTSAAATYEIVSKKNGNVISKKIVHSDVVSKDGNQLKIKTDIGEPVEKSGTVKLSVPDVMAEKFDTKPIKNRGEQIGRWSQQRSSGMVSKLEKTVKIGESDTFTQIIKLVDADGPGNSNRPMFLLPNFIGLGNTGVQS